MLITFRRKIVFFISCMVLFSSLVLCVGTYATVAQSVKVETIKTLAGKTRLMALKFQGAYDHIRNDGYIISQTPPVLAIMNSAVQGGKDLATWREDLESIFISVMKHKPYYTQMRYIGFAHDGREIVRVNQKGGAFERVAEKDLQAKANEFYFKEALSLTQGDAYFSKITYNKEHGQIEAEKVPTLRSIIPVFTASGEKFGFIVINVDYRILLREQYKAIQPEQNVFVINEFGDYMEFSPKHGLLDLILGGAKDNFSLQFLQYSSAKDNDEKFIETAHDVIYVVRLNLSQDVDDNFLSVVVKMPKSASLQATNHILVRTLIMSLVLTGIVTLLAAALSAWLTRSYILAPNDY